jgi:anthranilate phosphoribosyltransferase
VAIVVVGGHTRNIGKTSVVAGLIAAMPEMRWNAIKITQFGHGVCSANGEPCDCETADHTLAVSEEKLRDAGTDSSRYLAAGAERAFWVRTRQGSLHEAMPRVRQLIAAADNVILESNSVLRFLQPDVSLAVMDPRVADFKASALRYLDRADAMVVAGAAELAAAWAGVSAAMLADKPHFAAHAPVYCSAELAEFVRQRLASNGARKS